MHDIRLSVVQNVKRGTGHGIRSRPPACSATRCASNNNPTSPSRWEPDGGPPKSLAYLAAPGIERSEDTDSDGPLWQIRMATDESRRFRMQTSRRT